MKEGWEIIPFENSIQKVKYTTKVPSSDYLPVGAFPIVSQEEGLISGYWDNEADVFHHNKPVVIFGDHTRIIKYVDFDFVLGADGVKILLPVDELSAKFLSYYLRWYKVPSLGYSRHFKLLKEISVPIPPHQEQEKIVAELDCLTSIIEKKKQQLEELDKLAQSIFYDMFGDPYEQSFNYKPLDTLCKIVGRIGFRGYTRDDFVETAKDGAISLSPSNIVNGDMDYSKCSYITWSKYNQSPEIMIANGDILVVKTGSSYGKVAMVKNLPHQASINPQFVVLKDIRCNRLFLEYYLKTPFARDKYEEFVIGTAIPTFSQKKLGSLPVVNYPLDLQNDFAQKIEAIEKQKELVKRSIVETETLFNSQMDYWFNN